MREREERKKTRWAHSGTGINTEARGKEEEEEEKKNHPPPLGAGQPISTQMSWFTWRPKNLCVVIWHHQLPIKGEVTFFLFSPPSSSTFEDAWGNVMQLSKRNKDPFKHFLFSPHIRSLTWKKKGLFNSQLSPFSRTDWAGCSSNIHEFQLFSPETGTIHKFSYLPLTCCFSLCRRLHWDEKCSVFNASIHSPTNKHYVWGCPRCILYVCLLLLPLSVCVFSFRGEEKLPVCVLFTWQRHRAVWLMHAGLSLPGRLFYVLFIGVMCDRLPSDIILLIA